jgi:hypothetical protein
MAKGHGMWILRLFNGKSYQSVCRDVVLESLRGYINVATEMRHGLYVVEFNPMDVEYCCCCQGGDDHNGGVLEAQD